MVFYLGGGGGEEAFDGDMAFLVPYLAARMLRAFGVSTSRRGLNTFCACTFCYREQGSYSHPPYPGPGSYDRLGRCAPSSLDAPGVGLQSNDGVNTEQDKFGSPQQGSG